MLLETKQYKFLADPNSERGCCDSCPNRSSEASEYAQNTGCLPTPFDIIKGVENGDVWECHSKTNKVCTCAENYATMFNIEIDDKPTCGLSHGTLNGEQY